jgi:IS30 family transposase
MPYHLTQPKRIELSLLVRLGRSQRNAALVLGVSPSTICRKLRRNTKPSGKYHAIFARLAVKARRIAANQHMRKLLGNVELEWLRETKLVLEPRADCWPAQTGRHSLVICV